MLASRFVRSRICQLIIVVTYHSTVVSAHGGSIALSRVEMIRSVIAAAEQVELLDACSVIDGVTSTAHSPILEALSAARRASDHLVLRRR